MKKLTAYTTQMSLRWLCLVVVMLLVMLEVHATSTFYYKATVTPSPQGAGMVYIASSSTNNPPYQSSAQTITGSQRTIGYGETTLYMYAKANDNYLFLHWLDGDGNQVGTGTSYNATVQYRSTDSGSPTSFSYTAVFVAQTGLIRVKSADETRGSASISNPDNAEGDEVTLSANPDASNGVMFLGWTKGEGTESSEDYISTSNPLVLTASSETKGLYIAHFSDVEDKTFVRLQNKKTGRFISFYGTNHSKVHQRTISGNTRQDGFIFENSLKLISASDAQGNPETVFLRGGQPSGTGVTVHADLTAHHTQYSDLVDANPNNNQYMLTLEKSGDVYYIYTTFTDDGATMRSYFCDEGTDWLVMKSTADLTGFDPESAQWYLYTLDASTAEGAFGANAKAKYVKDDKYYTTMYADFAYECLDGVKAYYLTGDEDCYDEDYNLVRFTEVPGGKVPANMAVVLECPVVQNDFSTTKTVVNRLLPLMEGEDGTPAEGSVINEGAHFLKGYVSVNGSTVENNKSTMYVLSFDKSLGFYLYSKDTMNPNKAYLDTRMALEDNPNSATVKFAFGKDDIDNPDNPDDPDTPTPTDLKGDMNNDGKITIADVMILVNKIVNE